MFLVFLTISCVLFDSSSGIQHESVCYGKSVRLPDPFNPLYYTERLYFTPSNGGPRKLLMNNGQVLDPRITVSSGKVYFTDLTERDDGTFAATSGGRLKDVLTLEMLDCTQQFNKLYGHTLEYDVPKQAEFLEFNPIESLDQSMILWNRSDPQVNVGKRGEVRKNVFKIFRPTQADNGYYSFRHKDNTLESRLQLTVNENHKYTTEREDDTIFINYPWTGDGPWTVTYTPEHGGEPKTVIKDGAKIWRDSNRFSGRIYAREKAVEITSLEYEDAGIFEFRDPEGHLALTVHLNVFSESTQSPYIHVAIAVAGLLIIGFCGFCCVRRCCEKLLAKNSAAPTTHSSNVNQSPDPRPSTTQYPSAFHHQAVHSAAFKVPTSTSSEPLVTPPAHPGSVPAPSSGSIFLSSDAEPRFELKGLGFSSAPLLSSDTPSNDVYMSDKLNFL